MFRRAFLSRPHQSSPPPADSTHSPHPLSPGAGAAAAEAMPWNEELLARASSEARAAGGQTGGMPSHTYSPLFTSGLHPSPGSASPVHSRPATSKNKHTTPLLPLARMASNASASGSHPHAPPSSPARRNKSSLSRAHGSSPGSPRARKRKSSDSLRLSPVTPLKRSSSLIGVKGMVFSPRRGGEGTASGGERSQHDILMSTPPSAHTPRSAHDSLRMRSASDSPYSRSPLKNGMHAPVPALFDTAPSSLQPRKSASNASLRPFRFKNLLTRATSRAGSRGQAGKAAAEDGEETLDEVVPAQGRRSDGGNAPPRLSSASEQMLARDAFRPSVESTRGKSVDLQRLATASYGSSCTYGTATKASLRSLESVRKDSGSSDGKSSFESGYKSSLDAASWGRSSAAGGSIALEPLDPRRKSPSPLRPASRAEMHPQTAPTVPATVAAARPGTSVSGSAAVAQAAPRPATQQHKIIRITPPPLDRVRKDSVVTPVSPSSIRTFGPHATQQQQAKPSTTPTFKLTRPGGKVVVEGFPFPHQPTPEPTPAKTRAPPSSQLLATKADARSRTESGSFEFQAFESEMEIKGSPASISRLSKKSSSSSGVTSSPTVTPEIRAKARPDSGLMPLVLGGTATRSPLKERSNLANLQSTPPRKTGKIATKFAPHHLSPPKPLRLTKRTSIGTLKRRALELRARRDSRPVDWNLESEFASLEVGLKMRD